MEKPYLNTYNLSSSKRMHTQPSTLLPYFSMKEGMTAVAYLRHAGVSVHGFSTNITSLRDEVDGIRLLKKYSIVPQGHNFINRRWFFPLWGNQRGSSTDKTPPQPRIPSGMQPNFQFSILNSRFSIHCIPTACRCFRSRFFYQYYIPTG